MSVSSSSGINNSSASDSSQLNSAQILEEDFRIMAAKSAALSLALQIHPNSTVEFVAENNSTSNNPFILKDPKGNLSVLTLSKEPPCVIQ